ncbi:MAG: penicillin-binding protein 2 [Chloroflexota bacterium]
MIDPKRWRYQFIQFILGIIGVLIIVRIYSYQTSEILPPSWDEEGEYSYVTLSPARGDIYDRNGNLLAGNKTVYEVVVDLDTVRKFENAEAISLALSVNAGLDYGDLLNKFSNALTDQKYLFLADNISTDAFKKIDAYIVELADKPGTPRANTLAGIHFKPHYQRFYPENSLASNILGFVPLNNIGYFGVEQKFNNLLFGIPISEWVPIDPNRAEEIPQVEPGASLILTIDREIQSSIETILDNTLAASGSESGTIIVMDPRNGEILAMTSTPHLDLNDYENYENNFQNGTPFNRAISQAYEPGSVLKILTLAAALDTGTVTPETTFFDTGSIVVGGVALNNWDGGAWGSQDMLGCTQHSLNVCYAWIATQIGTENFYAYMKKFGLGHITGIDLAGEAEGRLKLPGDSDWYMVDLGTNAFGQGLSVTPIQMVMAASAIANNGKMVQPHILYAKVENGAQQNIHYETVGNPISPQTAQTMNEILAASLSSESYEAAVVDGYQLAGKTGTASIPVFGGYDPSFTNASFIGWGPVDDPRFMVYIWLEKPKSSTWSSEVASPVFKEVVEKLVVLMGIPPDQIRLQMAGQ